VAARVPELGGQLLVPPFDVLDAGRMTVLQDRTGAVLSLWQPRNHIGAGLVNDPGSLTMNSLSTPDPEAARDFYTALLGWTFEMGVGGSDYSSIKLGDRLNAGMQKETRMPAHWLAFFTVEDADEAAATVSNGGGQVMVAPSPIPAGRFAVFADPAGAAFAVFEGEVDD
jgi:predicted enzyme related to lactoylglutathione lyase